MATSLPGRLRLHRLMQHQARRRRPAVDQEPPQEEWRRHYPLFPRVLFVLDGTGPAGIDSRIRALHAAARDLAPSGCLRDAIVLAAPLVDLLPRRPRSARVAARRRPGPESGRQPALQEPGLEERRQRYPLFPPRPVPSGRRRTRRCRQPNQRPEHDTKNGMSQVAPVLVADDAVRGHLENRRAAEVLDQADCENGRGDDQEFLISFSA
ncbi:hypothetical protein [Streptomyces cellulosae]|uniref:PPM-type phosphatase domain-containing protein n=1 Tax=Streptomyces cellulosae TaxID=1968 RepID=A0ABW7YGN9_STRCE